MPLFSQARDKRSPERRDALSGTWQPISRRPGASLRRPSTTGLFLIDVHGICGITLGINVLENVSRVFS